MSYFRFVLPGAAVAAALALPFALAQQPAQPARPAQTRQPGQPAAPPPPKPDPTAVKTLGQAVDLLAPKRTGWLKTAVWQQVDMQGLRYEAHGDYLSGPDQRMRLDFKVKVGATDGAMQIVSDGATLWQRVHVGNGEPVVKRTDLKRTFETLSAPGMPPQVRELYMQSQAFVGLEPLLKNLQQQLVFTGQKDGRWRDKDVYELTGTWAPEVMQALAQQGVQPPFPLRCLLVLDKKDLWPCRVEWWGPTGRGAEGLLVQMEFRDPVRLKPGDPAPPEYAALLKFDLKNVTPVDDTKDVQEALRSLAKQMAAARPAPGTPAPR